MGLLGINPETVKTRLHPARRLLRDQQADRAGGAKCFPVGRPPLPTFDRGRADTLRHAE
jgi:hypothetical protein